MRSCRGSEGSLLMDTVDKVVHACEKVFKCLGISEINFICVPGTFDGVRNS